MRYDYCLCYTNTRRRLNFKTFHFVPYLAPESTVSGNWKIYFMLWIKIIQIFSIIAYFSFIKTGLFFPKTLTSCLNETFHKILYYSQIWRYLNNAPSLQRHFLVFAGYKLNKAELNFPVFDVLYWKVHQNHYNLVFLQCKRSTSTC